MQNEPGQNLLDYATPEKPKAQTRWWLLGLIILVVAIALLLALIG